LEKKGPKLMKKGKKRDGAGSKKILKRKSRRRQETKGPLLPRQPRQRGYTREKDPLRTVGRGSGDDDRGLVTHPIYGGQTAVEGEKKIKNKGKRNIRGGEGANFSTTCSCPGSRKGEGGPCQKKKRRLVLGERRTRFQKISRRKRPTRKKENLQVLRDAGRQWKRSI